MAKNGDIFYLWVNSLRLTKPYDALMNWNVFFRDFYSSEQEVCFYSCLSVWFHAYSIHYEPIVQATNGLATVWEQPTDIQVYRRVHECINK